MLSPLFIWCGPFRTASSLFRQRVPPAREVSYDTRREKVGQDIDVQSPVERVLNDKSDGAGCQTKGQKAPSCCVHPVSEA